MKSILSIWLQPVYGYINRKDHWLAIFLLLLLPVTCMILANLIEPFSLYHTAVAAGIGLAASCAIILFMWFMMLVVYAMQQNTPANMALIPDFKIRQMLAFALAILALSAPLSWLFSVRSTLSISEIWLFTLSVMLIWTSIIRNTYLMPVAMACMCGLLIFQATPPFLHEFHVALSSTGSWLHIVAGLMALPLSLNWIFGNNKDDLRRKKKEVASYVEMSEQGFYGSRSLVKNPSHLYAVSLQRTLNRQPGLFEVAPLILGQQTHWSTSLRMATINIGLIFLCTVILIKEFGAEYANPLNYLPGLLVFFFISYLQTLLILRQSLYLSRIEQGLLLLSPSTDSPRALTAALLHHSLRRVLLIWGLLFGTTLLLCLWYVPDSFLRHSAMLICCASLPLSLCLLGNHSQTSSAMHTGLGWLLTIAALFVISGMVLSSYYPDFNVFIYCAAWLSLSCLALIRGYLLRLRQPALFPAGRAV